MRLVVVVAYYSLSSGSPSILHAAPRPSNHIASKRIAFALSVLRRVPGAPFQFVYRIHGGVISKVTHPFYIRLLLKQSPSEPNVTPPAGSLKT